MKNNRLLCSTGAMVVRENGYNYKRALSVIAKLKEKELLYGGELMMLKFYYDKRESIVSEVLRSDVPFPLIHCEKGIGTDLSHAAYLDSAGEYKSAEALLFDTIEHFRLNCRFGEDIGARYMVLHLWGGLDSDSYVEYNISKLGLLTDIASGHGLDLLLENVPCTTRDPLSNWLSIIERYPKSELIFDTRFATVHEQAEATLSCVGIIDRLRHIHVSDCAYTLFENAYMQNAMRDFSCLRPILHPYEGIVKLDDIAASLAKLGYTGTVTLESPVMEGEELNTARLESSFRILSDIFHAD